jgi:NAD(P)-dependent dehydrogenase (short-subunit alcohol dehydrogenase family)
VAPCQCHLADLNATHGDETVRLIGEARGQALFVQADVGRADDIERMVAAAETNFGGLDCAINNAVRSIGRTPLADITEED